MYRNNGETACQICHASMSTEEFEFCDICPECLDCYNNYLKKESTNSCLLKTCR